MKHSILYILLAATCFTACKKEGALTPSNAEKDWYVITDAPASPVTHAIYLFYQSTGIPVFYKDTIGVYYVANDTNYVTLQVDYSPLGTSGPSGTLAQSSYFQTLTDSSYAIAAVNFLQANVIPLIPASVKIKSFLLLDSLSSPAYGSYAMKGFNTIALGAIPRLSTMSQDTLNKYKASVLRATVGDQVLSDLNWLNTYFYSVSRTLVAAKISWATDVYSAYLTLSTMQAYGIPTFEDAGFINKNTSINDYGYPQPPTATLDVNQYIEAIFTYSTADFTAMYGQYSGVMLKYNRMKSYLTGLGFSFN